MKNHITAIMRKLAVNDRTRPWSMRCATAGSRPSRALAGPHRDRGATRGSDLSAVQSTRPMALWWPTRSSSHGTVAAGPAARPVRSGSRRIAGHVGGPRPRPGTRVEGPPPRAAQAGRAERAAGVVDEAIARAQPIVDEVERLVARHRVVHDGVVRRVGPIVGPAKTETWPWEATTIPPRDAVRWSSGDLAVGWRARCYPAVRCAGRRQSGCPGRST